MKRILFSAGAVLIIVLSLTLSSCDSPSKSSTLDIGDRTEMGIKSATFDTYNDICEYSLIVYAINPDNGDTETELLYLFLNSTPNDANFPENGEYICNDDRYFEEETMYFGGFYQNESYEEGYFLSGSIQIDGTSSNVIIIIDITLDNGETKGYYYQGALTFSYDC